MDFVVVRSKINKKKIESELNHTSMLSQVPHLVTVTEKSEL
jgi:hypothetical protein